MTRVKMLDPKGTNAVETVPVSGRCDTLVSTSAPWTRCLAEVDGDIGFASGELGE